MPARSSPRNRLHVGKLVNDASLVLLSMFLVSSLSVSLFVLVHKYLRPSCYLALGYGLIYLCGLGIILLLINRYSMRNTVFISTVCIFSLVAKISLVFLCSNYPQTGDYASMHRFVELLSEANINWSTLSKFYDYKPFLGRSLPLWLPLRLLFGSRDILAVQIANCFISTTSLLLVYMILKDLVSENIRRFTISLLAIFPLHMFENLNYTHDIPGTFFFLLCVYCIVSILKHGLKPNSGIYGLSLGFFMFLLKLQRGIDLLVLIIAGAVLLFPNVFCSAKITYYKYKKLLSVLLVAPLVPYLVLSLAYSNFRDIHDLHHLRGGMDSFMVRGYNIETGGEYYRVYEEIDKATPMPKKSTVNETILLSQIFFNPIEIFTRLLPIKAAKFFLVGYASNVEGNLYQSGKKLLAHSSRGARVIFAPFFLALACLGSLKLLMAKERKYGAFLLVLILPIVGCLAVVFFGETSPRYSFSFHFVLAMLAGIGLSFLFEHSKAENAKFKLAWTAAVRKFGIYSLAIALAYAVLCLLAVILVKCAGGEFLFQDMKQAGISYKFLRSPIKPKAVTGEPVSLRSFEQWIITPAVSWEKGDYIQGKIRISRARGVTLYLRAGRHFKGIDKFNCCIYLGEKPVAIYNLSQLATFKRVEIPVADSPPQDFDLGVRVAYSEKGRYIFGKDTTLLRWGYLLRMD